jgi:hypothetical protein
MSHRAYRALTLGLWVVSSGIVAGCSEKVCPTIACVPRIELNYSRAVPAPYRLTVTLNNVSVVENCPGTRSDLGLTPGVAFCDDLHATITGVDLGHATNDFIGMDVGIGNQVFSGTATLQNIVNSRDCDLVCYHHVGTVSN